MRRAFAAAARAATVCVLAPVFAGCATLFPAQADPFAEPGADAERFTLEVENQNTHDATIYVVKDTPRSIRRVGDIGGLTNKTFEVPWDAVARMIVRIEFLADGACDVPGIIVGPGDELKLQIVPSNVSAYCYR